MHAILNNYARLHAGCARGSTACDLKLPLSTPTHLKVVTVFLVGNFGPLQRPLHGAGFQGLPNR